MKGFLARDPGMFVLAFATWAAANGTSLMLPGNAFRINPIYAEMAQLGVADSWCGLGMLADALLLALTALWGKVSVRAFVAILSAPLWFCCGVLLLGGAARIELLSAAGTFDVLGSIGLAAAGAQWTFTLAPAAPAQPLENEPWT